jgi:hypothetical protein
MGPEAYRAKFFNMVTEIRDRYIQFAFVEKYNDNTVANIAKNWQDVYLPTYMPDGFELVDMQKSKSNYYIISYKNKSNVNIYFNQFSIATYTFAVDSEDANVEKVKIKEKEAYFI